MVRSKSRNKKKLIRTAAIPGSLQTLLKGQLEFLNQHFQVIGVASEGEQLKKLALEQGIRTIPINIERTISPLKDLVSLYKLYRLFKKEQPYIVHSITPKAGLLSMIAAYFARVPRRMHTFTGLLFPTEKGIMKNLLLFFDKLICRFATHVYPEGNGVKYDLENYRVTMKPLKVIANGNVNGVDLSYFNPELFTPERIKSIKKQYRLELSEFIFINISRLVNDKGINELVSAFSQLALKFPGVKLILVGGYKNEADRIPHQTMDIIKNHDGIMYLGGQPDVRPFLSIADAMVFPSYREGFPNVVLEAGAMGKPCIVTDINGSNEIIENGVNGIIIPSKNESALLEAMKTFCRDQKLLDRMRENARPMIASRFDRSMVWEELLKEYRIITNEDN